MKKTSILILILAIALSTFSVASASSPAPGGPFVSAFYVQNISDAEASCIFVFYDETGAAAYTSSEFTIASSSNYEIYTPSLVLDNGSYSSVVSCSQAVQAIVNFSDSDSAASHSGVATPGMTWYIPNLYNNYWTYYSNVYVQNATSDPVDVTLDIYGPDPANPANFIKVKTVVQNDVPGYASAIFDQVGVAELLKNKSYSGKITATGDVAPIVNIYGGAGNIQLYSFNAFAGGALEAYVPALYSNYYKFNTEMKVQNVGGATANVTITYSTGLVVDVDIPPSSGVAYYTPSILPAGNTVYSAKVVSDQPVVVVVNESDPYNKAASYNGLIEGAATVSVPAVMKNYYGYNTDVNCVNLGDAATDVKITYTIAGSATTYSTTKTAVAAGKTAQFYTPTDPALLTVYTTNKKISAIVTSIAGEPLSCIVNESHGTLTGDTLYSYNAFPVMP